MSRNPISLLLVFVQFVILIFLFLTGAVVPQSLLSWICELGGLFLGLWALWTMRVSTLQITPDVAPGSVLITNGPYSFIRHPMYTALMLVSFGLLLNDFTPARLIAVIALALILVIKTNVEETLLIKFFKSSYKEYQQGTSRLIPFIF